jgi:hypothetical protein
LPINPELGENISIALRVQEKVDNALMTGSRPGFLRTISMLNCRKSISAVRGDIPIDELISRSLIKNKPVTPADIEEISGVAELWKDIEKGLDERRSPILGTDEDMQLEAYFEEHPQDLPATVHVFDVLPHYERQVITKLLSDPDTFTIQDCKRKMNRNHTFLVLGKDTAGKYICFHKQGPEVHHKFELRELESLIALSVDPLPDHMHLSFIEPIDNDQLSLEDVQEFQEAA